MTGIWHLICSKAGDMSKHNWFQEGSNTLTTRNVAKDDVKRSWQDSHIRLLTVSLYCVRFAGVGDTIRKDETVLSFHKLRHNWVHCIVEELFLRSFRWKDMGEGETMALVRCIAESLWRRWSRENYCAVTFYRNAADIETLSMLVTSHRPNSQVNLDMFHLCILRRQYVLLLCLITGPTCIWAFRHRLQLRKKISAFWKWLHNSLQYFQSTA